MTSGDSGRAGGYGWLQVQNLETPENESFARIIEKEFDPRPAGKVEAAIFESMLFLLH
jgi:hypothetical protein